MSKMKIVTIKEDTPEAHPHDTPNQKLEPECRETPQTSIISDQEPRESTIRPHQKMHLNVFQCN